MMFMMRNCEISMKSAMKEKSGEHALVFRESPPSEMKTRFGLETSEKTVTWALNHAPPLPDQLFWKWGAAMVLSCTAFSEQVTTD
jgi:hypothetical protein